MVWLNIITHAQFSQILAKLTIKMPIYQTKFDVLLPNNLR